MTTTKANLRHRALFIQRTLGTRVAAGFLRNRGASLEFAVAVLALPRFVR